MIARKLIGDGQNSCIWTEPWTNKGIRLQQFPQILLYHPVCSRSARVANLMRVDQWCIPDFVGAIFPELSVHFEKVPMGMGDDEWAWTAAPDGEYHMKHTHNCIRITKPIVHWHSAVWFANRIHKHSFISWVATGGKTIDKMYQWASG